MSNFSYALVYLGLCYAWRLAGYPAVDTVLACLSARARIGLVDGRVCLNSWRLAHRLRGRMCSLGRFTFVVAGWRAVVFLGLRSRVVGCHRVVRWTAGLYAVDDGGALVSLLGWRHCVPAFALMYIFL